MPSQEDSATHYEASPMLSQQAYDEGGVVKLARQAKSLSTPEDNEAEAFREKERMINEALPTIKEAEPVETDKSVAADRIHPEARYGMGKGEKRLDSQGNVIDPRTPQGLSAAGPQRPVPSEMGKGGSFSMPRIYGGTAVFDNGGEVTEQTPAATTSDPEQDHIDMRRDQINAKQDAAIVKGDLIDQGKAIIAKRQVSDHEASLPKVSDEGQGAPVDYPGMVLPNKKGIRPMLDTDAPDTERMSGGAQMRAENYYGGMQVDASNPPNNQMETIGKEASARGLMMGKPSPIETPRQSGATDNPNAPQYDNLPVIGEQRQDQTKVVAPVLSPEMGKLSPAEVSMPSGASSVARGENERTPMMTAAKPYLGQPRNEAEKKQMDADRKQHIAELKNTMATGTREEAANAEEQLARYERGTPWGSASNHPGFLGKAAHIASEVGQAALRPTAPYLLPMIPGSAQNIAGQEAQGLGKLKELSTEGLQASEVQKNKAEAQAATDKDATKPDYEYKQDDQGNMWRVDKHSTEPAQMVTFGPQGQPTLTPAPAGVTPPTATGTTATARPTFGSAKGTAAPASDQQLTEYNNQLPAITPALRPEDRTAFSFPTGYKPTIAEMQQNKAAASKANADVLAGNRDAHATAVAEAAANKQTLEEKVIEQVAKDIAPMDVNSLSRLKDITSMRSDQRSLIYARAKELNPNFNTAQVDRRVKMLDNYTNGSEGKQLQSFGTFLDHAGDANHIIQEIRNGVTPKILNVGINKLEREGWGATASQITAALEPVRKEFEGFLLGGRALYGDDRKAAETILNDASTPAQIQAALKQMATTVTARYGELDSRFKNNMGTDIGTAVGPISAEAYKNAGALGIKDLGGKELRDGKNGYGWYTME
jgi:hypothetical protein